MKYSVLVVFLLVFVAAAPAATDAGDFDGLKRVRAVWDVTASENETFYNKLALIQHAARVVRSKGASPVFVVALNGTAVKFAAQRLSGTRFEKETLDDLEDIHERLKELHEAGVKIITCSISMSQGKVAPDNLLPFVVVNENVLATIAALQNKGYAYLPLR